MADDLSPAAERVYDLLDRIADELDLDVEIEVIERGDEIAGAYHGDDVGPLIGHHGQMIDAIQHLAYRIAFHGGNDRKRLVIDASGYRDRRATALRAAADQAAEAAIHDG